MCGIWNFFRVSFARVYLADMLFGGNFGSFEDCGIVAYSTNLAGSYTVWNDAGEICCLKESLDEKNIRGICYECAGCFVYC